jgi:cytochrome P450
MMTGMDINLFEDANYAEQILEAVDDVFTSLALYNIEYSKYWLIERLPAVVNNFFGLTSHSRRCTEFYRNIMLQVLRQRRTTDRRNDLLQSLIDAHDSGILSEDEVIANIMVAGIAASGPTVVTMSALLYELGKNPEWQLKLQKEIDSVLNDRTSMSFDDLSKLPILDACMRESMRLHPTEARSFRRVSNRDGAVIVQSDGNSIHLPYGTGIQTAHYALHHDEQYWGNAGVFDPGRFLHGSDPVKCAFMSFGAGPRMCPGYLFAEHMIKSTMVQVLRRYNIRTIAPDKLLFPKNSMFLVTDGIHVVFERRQ